MGRSSGVEASSCAELLSRFEPPDRFESVEAEIRPTPVEESDDPPIQ